MSIQSIGLNSFLGSYDGDSPYYLGEQAYGESTLAPYIGIRGLDPFGDDAPLSACNDGATCPSDDYQRSSMLHGFTINIAALKNETYPYYLYDRSLINLDAQQLYSPRPKVNYEFGKDYVAASPDSLCPPYFTSKAGGCYDAPVPIRGAPIEFRKVYFRGNLVNTDKGYIPSGETFPRAFQAIFACSKPIEQSIFAPDDTCEPYVTDTLYNSRDDNFELSEYATERDWDEIEIFSPGGCENAFKLFTGQSFYSGDDSELKDTLIETGYMASGCDTFRFSGTSGIVATIKSDTLTIAYTGNCSGELSLTGIFSNSGQYTGSSDGCEGFTFSGINGIHTSIEEGSNQLIINYTGTGGGGGGGVGSGCSGYITSFSGTNGSEKTGYNPTGACSTFNFVGKSGISASIEGDTLTISYTGATGDETGCQKGIAEIYTNEGTVSITGCDDSFSILGTSGIDTFLGSDNEIIITYSNVHPLSIFGESCDGAVASSFPGDLHLNFTTGDFYVQPSTNNTGIAFYSRSVNSVSVNNETGYGIKRLNFVDFAGTFDTGEGCDYISSLTLDYTGCCKSPFTGFYSDNNEYTGLGCTDIYFSGGRLMETNVSGNILEINYTGCHSPFVGFTSDQNNHVSTGCTDIYFSGGDLMHTRFHEDTLMINYTGCQSPFINFSSNVNEYAGDGSCVTFKFSGASGINTSIDSNASTLIISKEELNFEASGCLEVEQTTDTVTYGIDKDQLLDCLGYDELEISYQDCETNECCTMTVLAKDQTCNPTVAPTTAGPPPTTAAPTTAAPTTAAPTTAAPTTAAPTTAAPTTAAPGTTTTTTAEPDP